MLALLTLMCAAALAYVMEVTLPVIGKTSFNSFEDGWNAAVNSTASPTNVKLLADWTAIPTDIATITSFGTGAGFGYDESYNFGNILVPEGKNITLDLNGMTINRDLTVEDIKYNAGYVILVSGGTLTLETTTTLQ